MQGVLEIRGIKKTITLDCEGPVGPIHDEHEQIRMGVQAKTVLDRKDFGIKWNRDLSKGVLMVGDKVEIRLEIEFIKLEKAKKKH